MVQMSQVLEHAHKCSPPRTRHIVEVIFDQALQARPRLSATLIETVNALEGDVPGGSLGSTRHAKSMLNRRVDCVDASAKPAAMRSAVYRPRRSEAKPR